MTDIGPSSAVPSRWPRWKGFLLVASLAINLLIFGLVAAIGFKHGWGPPPGVQQATLLRFARVLPPERRDEILTAIRPQLRSVRPFWRDLRKARSEVREALTAEPFDVARYRQAHDRLLDAEMKVRKAIHPLYDSLATRLTAQERREFAHWQARAERPWRKHHNKRSGREDEDGEDSAPQKSQATPAAATQAPDKR
ncbi:MAG: periplasmic heavy metal sensor [Hyphomicrobiaceae bacterium]